MSRPKYQIAAMLRDLGFRPCEIAKFMYPEIYKVDKRKGITLACQLLNYARKQLFSKYDKDVFEVFDDSKYVSSRSDHDFPFRNNSVPKIKLRKIRHFKQLLSFEERIKFDLEEILHFIYMRCIREHDYDGIIWGYIKHLNSKLYKKIFNKRIVFNRFGHLPVTVSAYVYLIFYCSLVWHRNHLLLRFYKLFIRYVKDEQAFRKKIQELLPLFANYFVPQVVVNANS